MRDEVSLCSPMGEAEAHEDGVGAKVPQRGPDQTQEHHVLVFVELLVDLVPSLLVDALLKRGRSPMSGAHVLCP
eukprot:1302107-Rhodomonas_salina.1